MQLNDLLQSYVNAEYDELCALAREAVSRLLPYCKIIDPDGNGKYMIITIVMTAIAADVQVTEKELTMMHDVLEISYAEIQEAINLFKAKHISFVDKFADSLPVEGKAHVLQLVTAFAAVDEKISFEETGFIKKILA